MTARRDAALAALTAAALATAVHLWVQRRIEANAGEAT